MTAAEIHGRLKSKFGDKIGDLAGELDPTCVIQAESIAEVSEWLRDEPGIDMTSLMCLSGLDYKEKLAVVYNLHSVIHNHKLTLKVEFTDRENPHCPSVAGIWGTADWHEREA
ncbi:MAG: NADH-quinone oxidoreductase subunit C, partial [Candidatus Zixiibacteriota bacterium]